ncbi:hypothetical protein JXI42_01640 [bacterium]|nr:hypothetical protein [bacterium]
MAVILVFTSAYSEDSSPYSYFYDSTAQVHVYAYMLGINIRVEPTIWYPCPALLDSMGDTIRGSTMGFTNPDSIRRECEYATGYVMTESEAILVENTGGQTLDFRLAHYPAESLYWTLAPAPGIDEFYLGILCGNARGPSSPLPQHFGTDDIWMMSNAPPLYPLTEEITSSHFYNSAWSPIRSMTAEGIHLPAELPGDALGDSFKMFFYFITPELVDYEPLVPDSLYTERIKVRIWAESVVSTPTF